MKCEKKVTQKLKVNINAGLRRTPGLRKSPATESKNNLTYIQKSNDT